MIGKYFSHWKTRFYTSFTSKQKKTPPGINKNEEKEVPIFFPATGYFQDLADLSSFNLKTQSLPLFNDFTRACSLSQHLYTSLHIAPHKELLFFAHFSRTSVFIMLSQIEPNPHWGPLALLSKHKSFVFIQYLLGTCTNIVVKNSYWVWIYRNIIMFYPKHLDE